MLNLSANNFEGMVPSGFRNLEALKYLDLHGNSLSGDVMNLFYELGNLVHVDLSSNQFMGSLDLELGSPSFVSSIQYLNISYNALNGSILPDLLTSNVLTDLNLSSNNLTGPILVQGSRNVSLTSLDLSHNSLDGGIPPEIGQFHKLLYLNLSHNGLNGNIPSELPDGLKGLDISSNNLSGVIPDNLKRFPESSFLPGNSLLSISISPMSPKGDSQGVTLPSHRSRLKPGIKAAIIAGIVGTCAILFVLCVAFHSKTQLQNLRMGASKGIVRNEHGVQSRSSLLPTTSKLQSTAYDNGDTSSTLEKPRDSPQHFRKEEGLSSPISVCSSSHPSPSKGHLSPESPGMLKVYSPDKLAGDLHLFDSSLAFTAEELSRAPAEVIGRSCHGTLYKATLDSGAVLAVKWLKEGISKGRKEFGREVKKLGSIRHPNFVPLVGYYWGPKDHERMIIYSYFDAQSLGLYLQGKFAFLIYCIEKFFTFSLFKFLELAFSEKYVIFPPWCSF
ncbi:unnamed protein product [Linum tenue]|uniref:Protein kinase domain-containing protein n=1 Tax=Linum tenue TaxID=586396 RepID=A0AAV0N188_9ROSI|nr:unnamed protein product [Linum tenue]